MVDVRLTLQQFVDKIHEQHTRCLEEELSKYTPQQLERMSLRTYAKPTNHTSELVISTTDVYDESVSTLDQYKFSVVTSWVDGPSLKVVTIITYPTGVVRP